MQQQITRGDYLEDLITIYIENNLQQGLDDLYDMFVFQCGEIQKQLTPAPVIKISFTEAESKLLTNYNTCYLAGITKDGHKETFNGSISFNTRGEVVYYEPTPNSSLQASTTSTIACPCTGISGVFANCTQPAIKAYFSINYVPTKLSELQNDTDFIDSVDLSDGIAAHNASTEAHPYIQSVITTETEALEVSIANEAGLREQADNTLQANIDTETSLRVAATEALQGSINAETTARGQDVSLAISTTEAYADNSVSGHNSSTSAHTYIQGLISAEVTNRENADNNLQTQIDGLAAASDVTDIVGTYAELQAYDTQHLNNNDIIKVLSDETHDDEPSYYRFNKTTGTFSYIGSESAAYTKAQADAKFVTQTTTINGEALSQNITLTATEVGALPSTTTINDLTTTAQQNAINSTATTAKINQIATNTTNIASNTSAISTINGKIPTDASSSNKLISAASLAASIADFANQDLSNLTLNGEARLHALKSYADKGELLTDPDGLAFVEKYSKSTFDRSKFTVVGSPNITDDGIASGFRAYPNHPISYIVIPNFNKIPSKSLKIIFQGCLTSNENSNKVIRIGQTKVDGVQKLSVSLSSNGSSWDISNNFIGTNWSNIDHTKNVELLWTGTAYYVKYIDINQTSQTVKVVDSTTPINTGNLYIGIFSYSDTAYGTYTDYPIDLKQFSITVDGVPVFSGNKTGIDTIKPDDYTVEGTPTISADGIASGFSSGNYITTTVDISNKPFILETPVFEYSATSSEAQYVFLLGTYNNGLFLTSTINGSGYITVNIRNSSDSILYNASQQAILNNKYQLKIVLNNTAVEAYIKINNGSYALLGSATNTSLYSLNSTTLYIGTENNNSTKVFKGSIDLNKLKIYIDGDLVYQPCLKIPYTESKTGSKIVNSIYRPRVSDMDTQFGYAPYYTLQEEHKGNYTVVGSTTISSDFVASGFNGVNYINIPVQDLSSNNFKIDFKFKYNNINQRQNIFRCATNSYFGTFRFLIAINEYGYPLISGTAPDVTATLLLTDNTTYDGSLIVNNNIAELYFNGSKIATGNWNLTINTAYISVGGGFTNVNWAGSIDLKEFKIYTDGQLAYEAVTDPNFTLPMGELYGLIGQRTLRDSYRNGINYWELYSNRDLEQGGSCTSGVEITFARPFADTNYVLSVPYSAKSSTAFTPTQTGDWIAKGKGIL